MLCIPGQPGKEASEGGGRHEDPHEQHEHPHRCGRPGGGAVPGGEGEPRSARRGAPEGYVMRLRMIPLSYPLRSLMVRWQASLLSAADSAGCQLKFSFSRSSCSKTSAWHRME